MTFSIVARDGDAWGVVVASKFLSAGAVVPQVEMGVGAVATQAMARVAYRGELLAALARGESAQAALDAAVAADAGRGDRQVGVVGDGGAASWTGPGCMPWAGGRTGEGVSSAYAIQGNILVGPEVVEEMERAWLASAGDPLDARLLAALLAGDAAGGDARGRQSAAILAYEPGTGYDRCGVLADLRVDDHPDAPAELARIHSLHTLYFGAPEGVAPLEGELREEVTGLLVQVRARSADAAESVEATLEWWMGEVNLETRHALVGSTPACSRSCGGRRLSAARASARSRRGRRCGSTRRRRVRR
ncbi:DUF1028 domain-containing protein [Janibacter sp. YIM B02568]|uniref:DUF1028 domain-containing protein n=1 Tax=Janibacter endophyticus TaxID=2806261 RepID=UPI001951CFFC|nr:DUF1028 domain-containing protein [Janibacter endophyticus]MBM6546117.1 DUF1028 domain-containing protein [Janibacter endophyticus]